MEFLRPKTEITGESLPPAPEGWLTLTGLCKAFWPNRKFNSSQSVIRFNSDSGEYEEKQRKQHPYIPYNELKEFIKGYKVSKPEYFNIYKTRAGNAEHFSPELVKIIDGHFRENSKQAQSQ